MSEVVRFWEGEEGCGAGLAMGKVGLDCWVLNGFGGGFWVEFWVVLGSGSAQGRLECSGCECVCVSVVLGGKNPILISLSSL